MNRRGFIAALLAAPVAAPAMVNAACPAEVAVTQGFGLAALKTEGAEVAYDTVWASYALGYIVTYQDLVDNLYEQMKK